MAPSNVLSMAQLRTLPLADQIKILMKNGEWAALPWGVGGASLASSWGSGVGTDLRTQERGPRPLESALKLVTGHRSL